jgi:glycosyltransferase involved in cell wall biosynthesis
MRIIAHTIVKNEENWVGYALRSVLSYVDEILVWDTGSTDKTEFIVKSLDDPKIKYQRVAMKDELEFTKLRQQMLQETQADWLMILDGDEIWPDKSIADTVNFIKLHPGLEYLVSPYFDLVGDIYHRRSSSVGHYKIHDREGQITIRFVNLKKISGLHWGQPYGCEGLFDKDEGLIQNRKNNNYKFVDFHFLHATHLKRSSDDQVVMQRVKKFKYELGIGVGNDFEYPSCLYIPNDWYNPWQTRSVKYTLVSLLLWPLQYIKQELLHI